MDAGFYETFYNFTQFDVNILIKADIGYDWMTNVCKKQNEPGQCAINIYGKNCKKARATIVFSNGNKIEYDFLLYFTSKQIKNIILIYDDYVEYNGEKRNKYTNIDQHVNKILPDNHYSIQNLRSICIENHYNMKGKTTKQELIYLIQSNTY
jgi:hypothetical protein